MEVEDLSPPAQLLAHRLGDDGLAVLQHVGLHRVAVLGGLLDNRHIPYAGEGHVEGAGDGGSGEGEHVRHAAEGFQLFLLGHAEALLLVDYHKAQVLEAHVLAYQPVSTHNNVHGAAL